MASIIEGLEYLQDMKVGMHNFYDYIEMSMPEDASMLHMIAPLFSFVMPIHENNEARLYELFNVDKTTYPYLAIWISQNKNVTICFAKQVWTNSTTTLKLGGYSSSTTYNGYIQIRQFTLSKELTYVGQYTINKIIAEILLGGYGSVTSSQSKTVEDSASDNTLVWSNIAVANTEVAGKFTLDGVIQS